MCNSIAVSLDDQLFLCRPQLQIEKIYYEPGEKGVVYASTAREGHVQGGGSVIQTYEARSKEGGEK